MPHLTLSFLCLAVLLLAVLGTLLVHALARHSRRARHRTGTLAANIAEGTRDMASLIPDITIPFRYLLGKPGSDTAHFTLTNAGDRPYFICGDQSTGEGFPLTGLPFKLDILGIDNRTRKVAINSTVNFLDLLTTDATGYAKSVPAAAGTYWVFGYAYQAGAASGANYPTIIEVVPCFPYQFTH